MTIMHMYRVQALADPIKALHDNMRTLALSNRPDAQVGWDMPIEKENLWIRQDVIPPNEDNIERYVAELNFTSVVAEGLRDVWKHNRGDHKAKEMKNIDKDVNRIKTFLYKELIYGDSLGPLEPHVAWQRFTAPVQRSKILKIPANHRTPWMKMHECMFPNAQGAETYQDFIRRHLGTHVTW